MIKLHSTASPAMSDGAIHFDCFGSEAIRNTSLMASMMKMMMKG
jgi:hypothetical protein